MDIAQNWELANARLYGMYRSSDAPPSKRHKTYLVEDTKPGQEGSGESQSRHKDYGMYEADVEKDTEKAGDENDGRSAERMEGTEGDDEFALLVSILSRRKEKNLGSVSLIILSGYLHSIAHEQFSKR